MKATLHQLSIRNFKAFPAFDLKIEGRHLLLYGPNGSGKSSLYWALYTFLQSARKKTPEVSRYFDPENSERLLNIHSDPTINPGLISFTIRDASSNDLSYRIGKDFHDTRSKPDILKADLASDFITYRFFFGFSNFRNSEKFDIWPLFEREILPFCVSTNNVLSPQDVWNRIKGGVPNPAKLGGRAGSKAYVDFTQNILTCTAMLSEIVDSISREAQDFYDKYFASGDTGKVDLKIGLIAPPSYNPKTKKFTRPVIEFGVQINGTIVARPQTFLNEAKLTQLALSVRLAASLVNLQESDLKLLVLDDLLVSLDMNNRMKIVEILLSETFANYQKIILTHDLGFFQETRRHIGFDHANWGFHKFVGNAKDGCNLVSVKTDLEVAQDYLANDQLDDCGNRLRKCVEANLETFLAQAKLKKGLDILFNKDKFSSLHSQIAEAKTLLVLSGHKEFAEICNGTFTEEEIKTLFSPDEIDPAKFSAASNKEKGKIIARLYSAKSQLQKSLIDLFTESSRKRLNAIKLLDEVQRIKDRILNPASHNGTTPIYKKEAEDAVKVIQALESALSDALKTLGQ